jgi:hypothetical protein
MVLYADLRYKITNRNENATRNSIDPLSPESRPEYGINNSFNRAFDEITSQSHPTLPGWDGF